MNIIKTQQFLARSSSVNTTLDQFPKIEKDKVNQIIDQLCNQNKIQILNPSESYEKQTVCLVV